MARVLLYERVVDAVLTNPSHDTEIQNGMKIKEEPADTTLNTGTTETLVKNFYLKNDTLIRNCSNIINHDKVSLPENDVNKIINNEENKQISNHSAYIDSADEIFNLRKLLNVINKRKRTKTEQARDRTEPAQKKQKRANDFQISKNMNMSTETIGKLRKRRKRRSITSNFRTKRQHTARPSKRKVSTECNICFRKFSSSRNCETHKQYYIGGYKCKKCKKHYITRRKLRFHTLKCKNIIHNHAMVNGSSNIYCNFCNRVFKRKILLQSHLFHFHNELIYSNNITECENAKSKNENILCENNTLTDAHEKSNNLVKSKKRNINFINNNNSWSDDDMTKTENLRTEESFNDGMSPTKKLRQPTLTEYLELCKRKRDINASLNKFNITKDDLSSTLFHDEKTAKNFKPKFSEMCNEQVDSLSTKSSNSGQTAYSTLEQDKNIQSHEMPKKPFVKLHADVEMMKSFLEKLPNITIEDKVIKDQKNDIASYYHEMPYSLRSLRTISSMETISNSRKRNSKDIFKKSHPNAERTSTRTEHNVTNSSKTDSNFWKPTMVRFKCKDCRIILTRCDEKIRNCHQIPSVKMTFNENISVPSQSNSMLFQESDIQNKMVLKNLEVSLERLTTVSAVDITKMKTVSDIEKRYNDSFLCKVCKKSFSSKLDKHMHIKSSHVAYMSSICDARFKLKHKLLQHYLSEHLFKQNQCCVCYIFLSNYIELKRHLTLHCLKYVQRESDQCPIDIEIKCSLIKNNYKCLQCDTAFATQSTLMMHQSFCILQEEMIKNQKDSIQKINAFPKIILKVQRSKNTNGLRVIHDENTHFDECSSKNSIEMTNKHQKSLINEENSKVIEEDSEVNEEPKINEDKQKSSVNNNLVTKEMEIINESRNSEKLLENSNSISNQDTASAQLEIIKSKINIFPCNICGKQFHTLKNLQQHIRSFSNTTDICPICGTAFSSKRLLQTHITAAHVPQISKTYSFHCMFCNQGFVKKYELRSHILHLHGQQILDTFTHDSRANQEKSDTQPAMCNICNLVFETHNRYTEHKMYYYKNHTFICSLCGQNFQGMYMLNHHNKLTHYSEDKRKSYNYICEICGEGFSHESHFHSHNMHVHLNEENLSEIAKESEGKSQFNHTSDIQEQIRDSANQKEIEQLPNEYICHICQLKCIDADDMKKHTALYSNDGDFKCDRCKRQCKTLDLLYQHRTLTHICRDIYNGYVCCICGEVLETIISLECHKKHFHSNDIAFECNNADDSKNCKQTLHSNTVSKIITYQLESNDTHSTAKCRYNCLFCDMKFFSANAIQTHIIQTHIEDLFVKSTGIKPTLSIIESDNICKPSVQQLVGAGQTSAIATTTSSTVIATSATTIATSAVATTTSTTAVSTTTSTTAVATTTLTSAVATTTSAVATTTSAVATTTSAVATTTSAVATTTSAVATTTSAVATTTSAVATTTSAVATTTSAVATTTSAVATTTSAVATTTSAIATTSTVATTRSTSVIVTTTSTSATSVATFEDNPALFLQDKFPNNILNKNGIKDKTNIELPNQTKVTLPKDNKIMPDISTMPSIRLPANITNSIAIALNNYFKPSIPLSIESESSNNPPRNYTNSVKSGSINEFKTNLTSSSNKLIHNNSGLLKAVFLVPQASKSNEITNQKPMITYNCNSNYTCPLCSLEYPSLMFFHAHLKYAHADSIRTDIINPFNQSVQEISLIKCLLCLCTFTDENKYKSHLKNSHIRTGISNSQTMRKIDDKEKNTTPEIITVDDDDDDNVENNLNQRTTESATTLVHEKQDEKIGKLRVKSFAKIMENLSIEYASKHPSKKVSYLT